MQLEAPLDEAFARLLAQFGWGLKQE